MPFHSKWISRIEKLERKLNFIMVSNEMKALGQKRSVIRELFEYGKKRKAEIGAENVFDFSLGNPSIPAPDCVNETIRRLVNECDPVLLHGYSSAQGDAGVRKAIADSINRKHGAGVGADDLYMTCGAAASLTISLKALACPGDEFIVFTPFFPEYRVFIENAGGKMVMVKTRREDFQIDAAVLENALTANTKAIILNSPNNPSGVVFSEETVKEVCAVLEKKQKEYGHPIYLISDEPYRELVYGDITVPYLPNYYDNCLVCYSYSKSLSLPGERIGYILVSPKVEQNREVYAAVCGAGRALGYVCAPTLFQAVIKECVDAVSDVSAYQRNRDLLANALTEYGFRCIRPDGAFYLFVEALEPDANAFCEMAKKHELLLVAGDDFGCEGFVRIAYCVTREQIERSLPAFRALAEDYRAKNAGK